MDEQQQIEQQIRDKIQFEGAFAETVANGKTIDWQYWMSMTNLSAAQASRLMMGLDPNIFENLSLNGPTNSDTSGLRHKAKRIEHLATDNGWHKATAKDWLAWAKSQRIKIHPLFALETMDKKARTENSELPLVSVKRCLELAKMVELRFRHWEELTSIGIGEDQSYRYEEEGIYPVRYEKHILKLLTREERLQILETSDRAPLIFPCTSKRLVQFIDGDPLQDFKLPEEFRNAVEQLASADEYLHISGQIETDQAPPQKIAAPSQAPEIGTPASSEMSKQVITHKIQTRTNALTAVISKARENALCPNDAHSIWAAFVDMAEDQNRSSPLLGHVENEGVKYQDESEVAFITKENFLRRVRRIFTTKNH